jgi:hypothetical protein
MRKNSFLGLGMLALIFGMALTGCGSNLGKFSGTWLPTDATGVMGADEIIKSAIPYELDNGNWEHNAWRGTYTVKGSTITFTTTQDKFGGKYGGEWRDVTPKMGYEPEQGKISGNTFKLDNGITYTKQ